LEIHAWGRWKGTKKTHQLLGITYSEAAGLDDLPESGTKGKGPQEVLPDWRDQPGGFPPSKNKKRLRRRKPRTSLTKVLSRGEVRGHESSKEPSSRDRCRVAASAKRREEEERVEKSATPRTHELTDRLPMKNGYSVPSIALSERGESDVE